MSGIDVDSWEFRIESKLGSIMQAQQTIITEMEHIKETVGDLKVVQTECKERLFALEMAPSPCATICENRERVDSLEGSRTWMMRSIVGMGFTLVGAGVIGMFSYLLKHYDGAL